MKVAQTPLAERYLYIPLFSFSMLTGFVFLEIFTKFRKAERDSFLFRPAIVCIIIIALLIGYSIKTIYRNQIWKDDIRFWEELVRQYPGEGLPHQNLGKAYEGQNRIEDAEREYITAIKAKYDDEGRSIAYNNLGNIHLREKKYDEAEQCFEKAISIQPDFSAPYCGIGWILLTKYYNNLQEGEKPERKFLERPIKYLNIAIQLNPQFVKAHSLLGNAFFMLKDFDKAKIHIQSVIKYGGEGADVELAKKILYYIQSQ
jgi:tetratricopeptide (TPR) repeat protein